MNSKVKIKEFVNYVDTVGKRYILYLHPDDVLFNRFPRWLNKYKDDFLIKESYLVKKGKGYIIDTKVYEMEKIYKEDLVSKKEWTVSDKIRYGETS